MSDAPHSRTAEPGAERAKPTDVLVVGDGIIGLSIAWELVRNGVSVRVIGSPRPGMASTAAAGLLAASIGRLDGPAQAFYDASLALYPGFVGSLVPFDASLRMTVGLVQVLDPASAPPPTPPSRAVTSGELAELEPAVAAPAGAIFHPRDGSIDNVRLVSALGVALAGSPGVALVRDHVTGIDLSGRPTARAATGAAFRADTIVLAAGAWLPAIDGQSRRLPVVPLKGQMLAIGATPLRHPVAGGGVYVVPRETETVVGSTVERAGFDVSTDAESIDRLREAAAALVPALAAAPVTRAWAGLRPSTPDMLPIVCRDAARPALVYACGHSKNGILLAPATARAVAALVLDRTSEIDLRPFSADRFA